MFAFLKEFRLNKGTESTDCSSIYSYETLRPITGHRNDLPAPDGDGWLDVIGCCDGIFCISHLRSSRIGFVSYNIVLWNPVTSETKILPPGPHHPARTPYTKPLWVHYGAEYIGFRFDPRTYHGPLPLVFTEVYSLRNDSWKTLDVSYDRVFNQVGATYLHQQWDISRNDKCYWMDGVRELVSFDMSTKVFEYVYVAPPQSPGLRDFAVSGFMLVGMVVITFFGEIWSC